jgi:hypothetical protein
MCVRYEVPYIDATTNGRDKDAVVFSKCGFIKHQKRIFLILLLPEFCGSYFCPSQK